MINIRACIANRNCSCGTCRTETDNALAELAELNDYADKQRDIAATQTGLVIKAEAEIVRLRAEVESMRPVVRSKGDGIHVFPVGHPEPLHHVSADCWCHPLDSNGIYIHHAKDGRERWERQGILDSDKRWCIAYEQAQARKAARDGN